MTDTTPDPQPEKLSTLHHFWAYHSDNPPANDPLEEQQENHDLESDPVVLRPLHKKRWRGPAVGALLRDATWVGPKPKPKD